MSKQLSERIARELRDAGLLWTRLGNGLEIAEAILNNHLAAQWQPIESAPRDDTDILLAWPDGHQQIDRLSNGEASFWYENPPSHWLPLPSPPSDAQPPDADEEGLPFVAPSDEFYRVAAQPLAGDDAPPCVECGGVHVHKISCEVFRAKMAEARKVATPPAPSEAEIQQFAGPVADDLRRLAERIVVEIGSRRFTQNDAADVVFALLSANIRVATIPAGDDEPLDAELAEAQRLYEQTTQGEWRNEGNCLVDENTVVVGKETYNWRMVAHTNSDISDPDGAPMSTPEIRKEQAVANAEWIAAAHNLWPKLVAAARDAWKEVKP